MTTDPRKKRPPRVRIVRLVCRRTGELRSLADHLRCPYCFGRPSALRSGDHSRFCDYHQGLDPLAFGFPPDSARHRFG